MLKVSTFSITAVQVLVCSSVGDLFMIGTLMRYCDSGHSTYIYGLFSKLVTVLAYTRFCFSTCASLICKHWLVHMH